MTLPPLVLFKWLKFVECNNSYSTGLALLVPLPCTGLDVTGPEGSGPNVVGDDGSVVVVPRETCNGEYMMIPMVGSVGNAGMCKHGACDVVGSKPENFAFTGLSIPLHCNGLKMTGLSDDIESLIP